MFLSSVKLQVDLKTFITTRKFLKNLSYFHHPVIVSQIYLSQYTMKTKRMNEDKKQQIPIFKNLGHDSNKFRARYFFAVVIFSVAPEVLMYSPRFT